MTRARAIGIAIIGTAAIGWYVWWPGPKVSAPPVPSSEPVALAPVVDHAEPPPTPKPPLEPARPTMPSAAPPPPIPLDERALMNSLRQLGDSSPMESLRIAREGELRFPGSPDAAERGWFICKSLVNLENFYEARDEARILVAKYPGTFWADDVERHLLTNPLELPGDPPLDGNP